MEMEQLLRSAKALLAGLLVSAASLWCSAAAAAPYTMMLERDQDVVANELVFLNFPSFDDLVNDAFAPISISPLNINPLFSTTGLTWDGSQYIMMLERDVDAVANEIVFLTFPSFDDLVNDAFAPIFISPLNINPLYSTTGLTWDGSQYIMMLERDQDVVANEIVFLTFPSFDDLVNDAFAPTFISPLNINPLYSTTGLDYDGSQYVMMLERDQDVVANEIVFLTFPTFDDLVNDAFAPIFISPLNINPLYSTTGLASEWSPNGGTVPEPGILSLISIALAGLAATRRCKH
jgi:hypothetical protein